MAKYYGKVGFGITEESTPGVWSEKIVERLYSGDILQNMTRYQAGEKINRDLSMNKTVSILSDKFFHDNMGSVKYVTIGGAKWEVTAIDKNHPRMILYIGGVYSGI